MPGGRYSKTLLVVFPEMFDQWGGYRLQKLFAPLEEHGWRIVALGAPWSSYRVPHTIAAWEGIEMRVAFDANPYVLGSRLKARLLGVERKPDQLPPLVAGEEAEAGYGSLRVVRRVAVKTLQRVWPDYYAGWVPFAIARGLRLVRFERPDAMLSSYPPNSAHVVSLAIQTATGIPWIADFRDPWANASAFGYPSDDTVWSQRLERAVLSRASAVTTVTESLSEDFAARYGVDVHTLPQGFAAAPRAGTRKRASADLALIHTGTLSDWVADIRPLVRAIRRARARGKTISLTLVGVVYDWDAELEAAKEEEIIDVYPSMSRTSALDLLARADVSVLLRSAPGKIWVTTKLWDYLAAERPILALIDPESDAARIVETTRTGVVVPNGRSDLLDAALDRLVDQRAQGALRWQPDSEALVNYEIAGIGGRLAGLLDDVVSRTARSSRRSFRRGRTG